MTEDGERQKESNNNRSKAYGTKYRPERIKASENEQELGSEEARRSDGDEWAKHD